MDAKTQTNIVEKSASQDVTTKPHAVDRWDLSGKSHPSTHASWRKTSEDLLELSGPIWSRQASKRGIKQHCLT